MEANANTPASDARAGDFSGKPPTNPPAQEPGVGPGQVVV